MFDKVLSWISSNPSKDRRIVPIEIQVSSDTGDSQVVNGPGGLIATPLEPPGPVSFYLWHTDPLYRAGTYTLRRQLLREALVELAPKIESMCKGHRWSKKKILEQLAAQQTTAVSPPQDVNELDEALCFVLGFQKLILDDVHKKVIAFPLSWMEWSSELPVWTSSLGTRCVYHLPGEKPLSRGLGTWLLGRVDEGWSCKWPVVEGKMEDVKKRCESMGVTPRVEKPKKEDWCCLLGEVTAKKHLVQTFG